MKLEPFSREALKRKRTRTNQYFFQKARITKRKGHLAIPDGPFSLPKEMADYLMKGRSLVYFMKTIMRASASILFRKISGSFF